MTIYNEGAVRRGRARRESIHMSIPQQYCLGFLLDVDGDSVLLGYKSAGETSVHPDRFNGIGGKCLAGELPGVAMVRECQEATGQNIQLGAWRAIGSIKGPVDHRWEVHCFATKQAIRPWLTDAGKDALILVRRADISEFGLAPHVLPLALHAFRFFDAIDPPDPMVIYDAGGPFK